MCLLRPKLLTQAVLRGCTERSADFRPIPQFGPEFDPWRNSVASDASSYASASSQGSSQGFPPASSDPVRCFRGCLQIPQVSLTQHIASEQAAMTPPQQPYQQVLTCFPVSGLAKVDRRQSVSQHRLCVAYLFSNTCKSSSHQTRCYTSYEGAYSFDLHPGFDVLQLPGCAGPDIRPRNYCVWPTSPCTCQLRSEPCC